MRLPAPLSRRKTNVYKNTFGHVLVLAGSRNMTGAAALTSLAAMRAGAGLVTVGIPTGLNQTVQKKISPVIMTMPLAQTKEMTASSRAFAHIQKNLKSFDVIALGPGLSQNKDTQKLIRMIVEKVDKPLVIDADALNALSSNCAVLKKNKGTKVLTPHPGEMARLTGKTKNAVEKDRKKTAQAFAQKYRCTVLLKGHRTVVASPNGKTYINKTGNTGMATAGSGDVLTGMIAALLGQGLRAFDAATYGAYLHGLAGNLAAKKIGKAAMIATDIIEEIPAAIRALR